MIPILLISQDTKKIQSFIDSVVKKNSIPAYALFEIKKEKTTIAIDQIRTMSRFISRGGTAKLIVIFDFETAKPETQNAFLKTLEEQSSLNYFILVASEESSLLPTILSRCKVVYLKKDTKQSFKKVDLTGSWKQLLERYQNIEKKRETAIVICDQLLLTYRQKLLQDATLAPFLKEIIQTRKLIDRNNLNPQAAIDHLILTFSSHLE